MNDNEDNKFLIIDSRPYGLFSIFLHTIDNIKWAEDNNYIPVVRWGPGRVDVNKYRPGAKKATEMGNPKFVGTDPNFINFDQNNETKPCLYSSNDISNSWENYFEPLNEYSVDNALRGHHEVSDIFQVGFHDLNLETLEDKFLIYNLHSYTPLNTWLYFIDKKKHLFQQHRKKVNHYIEKYVKVRSEIQQKVNNFVEKYYTKEMVGIHVRGTDKKTESAIGQRPFVSIDDYLSCIEKALKNKPDATLFIASDNNEAIKEIFKYFKKNKKVVYNCTRMPSYNSIIPVHLSSHSGIKAGEEALIDCMLLSLCDHLICTDSNLSAAALYFNPDSSCTFVNNHIGRTV